MFHFIIWLTTTGTEQIKLKSRLSNGESLRLKLQPYHHSDGIHFASIVLWRDTT